MSIMKTVVLAYSGGLDTSVAIPLLKERYDYDRVITVVADVGQPAPKYVKGGDRNQHKDPRRDLAKDMCDTSSSDNLWIIGGEDERGKFGSEKCCERSRFGYTVLDEMPKPAFKKINLLKIRILSILGGFQNEDV